MIIVFLTSFAVSVMGKIYKTLLYVYSNVWLIVYVPNVCVILYLVFYSLYATVTFQISNSEFSLQIMKSVYQRS